MTMTTTNTLLDPATSKQKQLIAINIKDKEHRATAVASVTGDGRTSTTELTFTEANTLLQGLGITPHVRDNWGVFDIKNPKHRIILSEVISIGHTTVVKGKTVADMAGWFSNWLHTKAPVKKPLKDMTPQETEKIIKALQGVFRSKWQRRT